MAARLLAKKISSNSKLSSKLFGPCDATCECGSSWCHRCPTSNAYFSSVVSMSADSTSSILARFNGGSDSDSASASGSEEEGEGEAEEVELGDDPAAAAVSSDSEWSLPVSSIVTTGVNGAAASMIEFGGS